MAQVGVLGMLDCIFRDRKGNIHRVYLLMNIMYLINANNL